MTMNIAEHIITKVGRGSFPDGVRLICAWLRRSRQRVYCFTYPRARGGTDGLIPARDQLPLLRAARLAGIDLTPADFFGLSELPPLGSPANDNGANDGAATDDHGQNMAPTQSTDHANPTGDLA